MSEKLYSVLINSCDKYEDAWYPFFELVKKYWPQTNCPFFLNTERKGYKHEGIDLTVLNCLSGSESIPWGKRIKDCLERIETPYVILLLEDFFFQREVDQEELCSCIRMMEENKDIVAIYFKQIEGYTKNFELNQKYYIMSENKRYKLNLQAALWRREELLSLVFDNDSPWSFEEDGAARVLHTEKIFLCSKHGTHTNMDGCVFPYLTERRLGYGIWASKWLWNNEKLFRKSGIAIKPISLERFTPFDMLKYYIRRVKEKITTGR